MKMCLLALLLVALVVCYFPFVYVPADAEAGIAHWFPRLVLTLVGLAAWFGTQKLIGDKRSLPEAEVRTAGVLLTQTDVILAKTDGIHRFLLARPVWANALLICSSGLIDCLGVFLLLSGICGASIRPFLGLLMVCGLRQILQGLTTLPPPPTMIWRYPGFPSVLVTYGVANDLFFSGHTAMALYGVVELARLGQIWMIVGIAIACFEIVAVLLVRAHYTMDVYAGMVTALVVALVVDKIAPFFDKLLCAIPGI